MQLRKPPKRFARTRHLYGVGMRRLQAASAEPNAAHLALAFLAKSGRSVSVITQNIDDLHERFDSVVHLQKAFSPVNNQAVWADQLFQQNLPKACGQANSYA